jgi:hypothetical protein
LNRVVLTRHPAEESDTLLRLLHRTTSKVEGFVEEWEANRALGSGLAGGLSLGTSSGTAIPAGGSEALGLTPVAKKSSVPAKKNHEGSPLLRGEEAEEKERRSRTRERAHSNRRSKSKKDKKDKRRRRAHKREGEEIKVEKEEDKKERKSRESEPRPATPVPERGQVPVKVEGSEESSTREDRRSPSRRRDVAPTEEPPRASSARPAPVSPSGRDRGDREAPAPEERRIPRSPSRSPPGFRREEHGSYSQRGDEVRDKPKKDKGYNHYIRGREFRDKYGYDRGRGRGYHGQGR